MSTPRTEQQEKTLAAPLLRSISWAGSKQHHLNGIRQNQAEPLTDIRKYLIMAFHYYFNCSYLLHYFVNFLVLFPILILE